MLERFALMAFNQMLLRFAPTGLWQMRFLAIHLASSKLRARFARSRIGLLWLILNPIILSSIIGFIIGRLTQSDSIGDMVIYVLVGIVTFDWFSQSVALSSGLLSNEASTLLRQAPLPFSIFPIQHVLYTTVSFLLSMISYIFVATFVMGIEWVSVYNFYFIPLVLVSIFFFLPFSILISVLAGVFRELAHIIPHVMLVIYYTSPVFIPRSVFDGDVISGYTALNPVTAILDIQRDLLTYATAPNAYDFLLLAAWGVIGWCLAVPLLIWGRRRLVFYG